MSDAEHGKIVCVCVIYDYLPVISVHVYEGHAAKIT